MTITIIVGIVTLILGGAASWYLWETLLDKKKRKLLEDAEVQAEMLKEKKIIQAKEKYLQLKTDHENYVNERNSKIAQAENKLKQKETIFLQRKEELQRSFKELFRWGTLQLTFKVCIAERGSCPSISLFWKVYWLIESHSYCRFYNTSKFIINGIVLYIFSKGFACETYKERRQDKKA
jgi:hypothetical protein